MRKMLHLERTKHKGGSIGNNQMPKKSGVALCGIKLDQSNIKSSIEDMNCVECHKKISPWLD